jgi:hypothetical protein
VSMINILWHRAPMVRGRRNARGFRLLRRHPICG